MALVAEQDTYRIELPVFEGPFDLLLFFIERDELDIYDIPISRITFEFFEYLKQLEQLNMEVASEFILVAGTLMRIKSRMLLPRPVLNEEGEPEDPRKELVQRLIEYKRFKGVQERLEQMEEAGQQMFKRPAAEKEEKMFWEDDEPGDELLGLDLYTITRTFKRIWERHSERMARPTHVIRQYPYELDKVKTRISVLLLEKERFDFVSFVLDEPTKMYCVFCFLSVLEMAQAGQLSLVIGKGFNNFWVSKPELREAG